MKMKVNGTEHNVITWTKEDTLQQIITSVMEKEDFRILNAIDEHDLFRLLEKYRPVLIILDVGLPRILGLEVCELIKKIDRFRYVKILLISSQVHPLPGADEYVEREHIQDLLVSKVRKFIPDSSYSIALPEFEMGLHEDARRIAGIIVSDIVLYNKEKVEQGIRNNTFYETLEREIEEGRRFYSESVSSAILSTTNYYNAAIQELINHKIMQSDLPPAGYCQKPPPPLSLPLR